MMTRVAKVATIHLAQVFQTLGFRIAILSHTGSLDFDFGFPVSPVSPEYSLSSDLATASSGLLACRSFDMMIGND